MSRLTVLLLTYNRLAYAEDTLTATLKGLRFSGEIDVHIADDGSPVGYLERLVDLAGQFPAVRLITVSNSGRKGYGASYNLATQAVHLRADYVLPLEDDWVLTRELDVDSLIRVFNEAPSVGCIRLGYVGFTQALRGELFHAGGQTLMLLDHDSPERHVFAGHPRIERVDWARAVGPWPEGVDPGTTEFLVAGIPAARMGIAWPLDLVRPCGDLYAHIGTVQARDDQGEH